MENKKIFFQAKRHLVGGVNSPVRSFKSVGGVPAFIRKAEKCFLWDEQVRKYIDYCLSWGALILGHSYPEVINRVKKRLENGTSYGASTVLEVKLAQLIKQCFTSVELVRLVNSGTESVMTAVRLARGFKKKNKIIKFTGAYHGHCDYLLSKAGSGIATLGIATSGGVPASFAREVIICPFNNLEILKKTVRKYQRDLAAILMEPVMANCGVILPEEGFLKGVRELCDYYGLVLIFDEVITGFRLSLGGAQQFYSIKSDLTCLGKILGGGFPLAAVGGKREIMKRLAPSGDVYQAGTLSGNPIAVEAGIATVEFLIKNKDRVYSHLEKNTDFLCQAITSYAKEEGIKLIVNRIASMFSLFFSPQKEIKNYQDALSQRKGQFKRFFHYLLKEGVYLPPSPFETSFLSLAHKREHLDFTVEVMRKGLRRLKKISQKG